jgi:o-succinylbenzoate synthase
MTTRDIWIVAVCETNYPSVIGFGECAPLPQLSVDALNRMDEMLGSISKKLTSISKPKTTAEALEMAVQCVSMDFPSIRFGLETALLDLLNQGQRIIFKNRFLASGDSLPINGLIWMNDTQHMRAQLDDKLAQGFTCIKIKIGALDFDNELSLLTTIREQQGGDKLVLRVDANGAFDTSDVLSKLKALQKFNLHSIEQPIMPRQFEAMQLLCSKNIVPIALDEELIGVPDPKEQKELLEFIKPQYIILKPSLVGGIAATRSWIKLAESMGIGWWITSALESNIGLNSICQLTADYNNPLPQGLGTGQLYDNNFESPLQVSRGYISYNQNQKWALPII